MPHGLVRGFQRKLNGRKQHVGMRICRRRQCILGVTIVPDPGVHANLLESYVWAPSNVGSYPEGISYYGCHQMIGDVWEWTSSEYTLYPGFRSKFSEYTDKWSINQKVLRGGSFATSASQIRNQL